MRTAVRIGVVIPLLAVVMTLVMAAAGGGAAELTYRIGVDDVLGISVWDNKDVDQVIFVRPDGLISLPLVGQLPVVGLTVAELEAKLSEAYQRTIKGARVTVMVREIRSRPVFFIGGVGRTGPMQLTQELTLLQAISASGGLVPAADLESAYVLRGTTVIPVNFTQLIQKADITQNITLQPGDTVVVPLAELVYVEGDIKRAGPIKHTKDLTLLEAITQAGGFTDLTAPRQVTLVRTEGGNKERLEVNVNEMLREKGPAPDMLLRPKDLVIVTITDVVYVQGEVRSPAAIKFTKDMTMLKAIAQVGGFTNLAAPARVSLVRGEGVKRETTKVNVEEMLKGATPDIPLKPNDIVIAPQRLF
jgi:polysaccharide biosynthesis/export protein